METNLHSLCPRCKSGPPQRDPFCPLCGHISPSVLTRGSVAVEIGEIPSAEIRSELQAALRNWFPRLDPFQAEDRLKSSPSLLVAGIDEESGRRILDALKAWKVNGRLVPQSRAGQGFDWKRWILNPGLAVSALALFLSWLVGGVPGLIFLLAALAAPPVTGLLRRKDDQPLVPPWSLFSADHHWIAIAGEYAQVIQELEPLEREMLRSVTAEVFDLVAELKSGSVAAVSAGGEEGELYRNMREAVRRAVILAAATTTGSEEERSSAREELGTLSDLIKKTTDWFRTLGHGETKPTLELSEQLRQVTESIDRIVQDVRSPREERPFQKDKTTT